MQKSGAKDESSRSGTLTFNGTHASERGAAARKVEWGPALREFENFVGSRFTPACNTSKLWTREHSTPVFRDCVDKLD